MNGSNHGRQLGLLTELCRELIKLGVMVGLSDARPALSARGALAERKLWIEVDLSGGSFVWRYDGQARHGVGDPAGAAAQIAEHLRLRDSGTGDRP